MQQQRPEEEAAASPSFRMISPPLEEARLASHETPPAELPPGLQDDADGAHDDDEVGSDFEFAVASRDSFDGLEDVTADEIFSNGLIRPLYPLFQRALALDGGDSDHDHDQSSLQGGEKEAPAQLPLRLRELMVQERDMPSASESESEEHEIVPAGSYCVWSPRSAPASPELRRKSHSTGTASKRWRLRNLVVGRSHSDGKERLVFLESAGGQPKKKEAEEEPAVAEKKGKGKGRGAGTVTETDMMTAHRLYYARGGAAQAGDRRRSFLPYRKDLLGFFANVKPHGAFQPF